MRNRLHRSPRKQSKNNLLRAYFVSNPYHFTAEQMDAWLMAVDALREFAA